MGEAGEDVYTHASLGFLSLSLSLLCAMMALNVLFDACWSVGETARGTARARQPQEEALWNRPDGRMTKTTSKDRMYDMDWPAAAISRTNERYALSKCCTLVDEATCLAADLQSSQSTPKTHSNADPTVQTEPPTTLIMC